MCLGTKFSPGYVFRDWGSDFIWKTWDPNQLIPFLGYKLINKTELQSANCKEKKWHSIPVNIAERNQSGWNLFLNKDIRFIHKYIHKNSKDKNY